MFVRGTGGECDSRPTSPFVAALTVDHARETFVEKTYRVPVAPSPKPACALLARRSLLSENLRARSTLRAVSTLAFQLFSMKPRPARSPFRHLLQVVCALVAVGTALPSTLAQSPSTPSASTPASFPIIPRLKGAIAYGGDYNPEQWPEEVWEEDVKLMREAGVNFVSIAIFSWAKLQSDENTYHFEWLDRIMDLLAKNGIAVDLATATASPPPWLSAKYPDVLAVDAQGRTYYPGARQQYSPSSPTYRRFAAALVTKLAERYKNHPALVAWHINNEYACHMNECHSEASTRAFRAWLKSKYKTIEALNAAWGTAFWSQVYYQWDEILTPKHAPYHNNPTQQLDFKRFTSDAFLECCEMEHAILRAATPDVPVTTNFMAFFKPLDYRKWAKGLDFTSWDSYPDPLEGRAAEAGAAAGHDLVRSLKPDRPFVLMEQTSAAVNWRPLNATKEPGVMRLQSLQAVARGADGVLFFQWRAAKAGAEKFHSGMVGHVPAEKSRTFAEIKGLGAELKKLTAVTGTIVPARAAIAFDWNAWWAIELESKPGRIDYADWARQIHRYFYERNIPVDFAHPEADLSGYDLVVAPSLYLLSKDGAKNLNTFVERGGTLLATFFSGVVDPNEQIVLGGYPAWLRPSLGLWVEEWAMYGDNAAKGNSVRFTAGGQSFPVKTWADVIHLDGAQALATYERDFFSGGPAITVNRFGQGTAFYLGARIENPGLAQLLDLVCKQAKVSPLLPVQQPVEVTLRRGDGKSFLFLLNHSDAPVSVPLAAYRGTDLLTDARVSGQLQLGSFGVAIIALEP
jgi:beta-galactosidase